MNNFLLKLGLWEIFFFSKITEKASNYWHSIKNYCLNSLFLFISSLYKGILFILLLGYENLVFKKHAAHCIQLLSFIRGKPLIHLFLYIGAFYKGILLYNFWVIRIKFFSKMQRNCKLCSCIAIVLPLYCYCTKKLLLKPFISLYQCSL